MPDSEGRKEVMVLGLVLVDGEPVLKPIEAYTDKTGPYGVIGNYAPNQKIRAEIYNPEAPDVEERGGIQHYHESEVRIRTSPPPKLWRANITPQGECVEGLDGPTVGEAVVNDVYAICFHCEERMDSGLLMNKLTDKYPIPTHEKCYPEIAEAERHTVTGEFKTEQGSLVLELQRQLVGV